MASYTHMEESFGGRSGVGHGAPTPPPPPPPLGSGRRTPVLQPGCRPSASPGSTIYSYTTTNLSHSPQSPVHSPSSQHGTYGVRTTTNYQQVRGLASPVPNGRLDGPVISSLKWYGSEYQEPQRLDLGPSRVEVPSSTVDTDLALSLVNETRPSFEMKTAGIKPLTEQHLLALVEPELVSPGSNRYAVNNSSSNYYPSETRVQHGQQQASPGGYGQGGGQRGDGGNLVGLGGVLQQAIHHKERQHEIISGIRTPDPSGGRYTPSKMYGEGVYYTPGSSVGSPGGQPMLQQAIQNKERQNDVIGGIGTPEPGHTPSSGRYTPSKMYGEGLYYSPGGGANPTSVVGSPGGQPMLQQAIQNKERQNDVIGAIRSPGSGYGLASPNYSSPNYSSKPAVNSEPQPMLQQAILHRENQLLSNPLHVDTRSSRSPYAPGSVSPQEFDPNGLCRELRQTHLEGGTASKSPIIKKPTRSYSPQQLSAYRSAPMPLNLRGPLGGDDVDALTNRMIYNMETGCGAAGDYNCAKCGEGISGDRPGCTALNQTYHLDCFVCTACNERLAGGSFYAIDGKPYCEPDYVETLDKCTVCGKAIMDRILRASGKAFHPACFLCTACGKCLDGVPFTIDSNNQVHCVQCFHDKYAPRCAICNQPIVPEEGKEDSLRIVAMDKSFHVECYKCEDCGMKLSSKIEGHGCYPLDDHLLCKSCNAERVRQLTAKA